jgi:hypothetical protein
VVIDNCLLKPRRSRSMWGWRLRHCDRLLPARSQRASRPGEISFWGDFAAAVRYKPNQPAPAFRVAAFVSGVGNGELCPSPLPKSPIPDPPPVRPHTNEKAGRVPRLSCCGDLRSHRLRANLNSMRGPVGQETDGKEAGRGQG